MTSHKETCVSELNDWHDCSTCAGPVSGAVTSSLQKNREEDTEMVVNLSQGKHEKKWAKVKDLNLQARADHEEELWTDVVIQRSSCRWPCCRMCVEPGAGLRCQGGFWTWKQTQGFAISTNPINCTDGKNPPLFFFFFCRYRKTSHVSASRTSLLPSVPTKLEDWGRLCRRTGHAFATFSRCWLPKPPYPELLARFS